MYKVYLKDTLIFINGKGMDSLYFVNNINEMDNWNISIEHCGVIIELELKAKSYADAFIKVGLNYPNCSIISIKPIRLVKKTKEKRIKQRTKLFYPD